MGTTKEQRSAELRPLLDRCLQPLLGGVFLVAGLGKVADLQAFHDSFINLPFLGGWAVGFLTIAIPVIEVTLGACLLLGHLSRVIYTALVLLTSCFALVSAYWVKGGMRQACGCFGFAGPVPENAWWLLLRNLLLLATVFASFRLFDQIAKRRRETVA